MKARLPLAPERPAARATTPRSTPARGLVVAGRTLVCCVDDAGGEDAQRFAGALLAHIRARDACCALLLDADALCLAGSTRHALDLRASPEDAHAALVGLPQHCVAVAVGARFAAHFAALLNVRISARATLVRSDESDLVLTRDAGQVATLIGDWLVARAQAATAADQAEFALGLRE